MQSNQQIREEF